MSDLTAEYDDLQRRVEDLRGFEREYRGRLRTYLYGLLADLSPGGAVCTRHRWEDCEDVTCRRVAGEVAAERERIAVLAEKASVCYLAPDKGWLPFADLIRKPAPVLRDMQGGE